jgi:hypothetical protein
LLNQQGFLALLVFLDQLGNLTGTVLQSLRAHLGKTFPKTVSLLAWAAQLLDMD